MRRILNAGEPLELQNRIFCVLQKRGNPVRKTFFQDLCRVSSAEPEKKNPTPGREKSRPPKARWFLSVGLPVKNRDTSDPK